MSEKRLQEQSNDKKHRKLIRSPEKLSPCDLDPPFNPSFLSTATNIFAVTQSNSRSSPTKHLHNDHHISAPYHFQQVRVEPATAASSSLPPSTSTPAIALYRKPSITIKYSKDDEAPAGHQSSSLAHHQQISKSIDSNHPFTRTISTKENADQMSNNFLINVNSCRIASQPPTATFLSEAYQKQQQAAQIFGTSPTSQSLNLNLYQSDHNSVAGGHITFNSNNPFLNDTFDAITAHEDEGGGKINTNFFNIDDNNESELLYLAENTETGEGDVMEEQLLKNKREKFSNASTMKICLVVSPPTNKLFQVSLIEGFMSQSQLFWCDE